MQEFLVRMITEPAFVHRAIDIYVGRSIAYINAMFDRCENPARGRDGGKPGAAGAVRLDDGSALQSKGMQWIPDERHLVLELPGGGGFGDPASRDRGLVEQDVAREYISAGQAASDYTSTN